MKWTKDERFPNDKLGIIKDEFSDKMKEVGARLDGFVSDVSGKDRNKDLKQRGKADIAGSQDLPKRVEMVGIANHSFVQEESTNFDREIVSTPVSISDHIVRQAMVNTSNSEYTPVEIGSLKIERNSFYSHFFPLTPVVVTNRGCIKVSGKNFDYIQIIQRN
ncbi:MAG TPA: hypothetical protein VE130_13300 [Nitrososphaeraceae archaeon]|nr:hypothetical protein [Nitrososphaeraceae archaeon]